MTLAPCKALITVVSRTEAIDTAVEALRPEVVSVISSQDVMGTVGKKCEELGSRAVFRPHLPPENLCAHLGHLPVTLFPPSIGGARVAGSVGF